MTDTEFNLLVDRTFEEIDRAIEASGIDLDAEFTGGILELTFENDSKIILNRQGATQELWVAAKSGGFHYVWRDGKWCNTRDGSELLTSLAALIAAQSGEKFSFASSESL